MNKEWKRIYNKEKLSTYLMIAGVILPSITLLFIYGRIYNDVLLQSLSGIVLIAFIVFSYIYLTKRRRRNPPPLTGGKMGSRMKSFEELTK